MDTRGEVWGVVMGEARRRGRARKEEKEGWGRSPVFLVLWLARGGILERMRTIMSPKETEKHGVNCELLD